MLDNSVHTHSNGKVQRKQDANRRTIVESGTDEFFGLDTKVFKNQGFFAGAMDQLMTFYEDTGKDYVADLYSDALSDYWGGTVQVNRILYT